MSAQRITIGIFGPRNAGKSTIVNLLTGQEVSIVSEIAGTTTDPVSKPMEINGLGACVFIDTAGYDDEGRIGIMRVTRTKQTIARCDIAIFLIPDTLSGKEMAEAERWYKLISERCERTLMVINQKRDDATSSATKQAHDTEFEKHLTQHFSKTDITYINAHNAQSREVLLGLLGHVRNKITDDMTIVTHLVKPSDMVLLVMPQDIQAPAGRLILPQVQTIRELLDYGCTVVSTTTEQLSTSLDALSAPPALIITDSQAFSEVYKKKPEGVRLTSFSVLFARWKGDIDEFIKGANAIATLTPASRVLIAEACTHAPLAEDIGREKIPAILRRLTAETLQVDIVSGNDLPTNLDRYDLVIHCGACMFGRAQVLSRIEEFRTRHIPVTNFGVAIAYLTGILDKIVY